MLVWDGSASNKRHRGSEREFPLILVDEASKVNSYHSFKACCQSAGSSLPTIIVIKCTAMAVSVGGSASSASKQQAPWCGSEIPVNFWQKQAELTSYLFMAC
jgi:hypothetical protein